MDTANTLKTQLADLRAQLIETTDETRYDQLLAEINQVEKTINLADARARQEAAAAAESAKQAQIAAHKAGVKQLKKLQDELNAQSQELFAALERFASTYDDALANAEKAALLSVALRKEAQELGQPAVELIPVAVAGIPEAQANVHRISLAEAILRQYLSSWSHIKDAKHNGQPAPNRPSLDWYNRGSGEHWPRGAARLAVHPRDG